MSTGEAVDPCEVDAAAYEAAFTAELRRWEAAGYRIVITLPPLDAGRPGAILDFRTRETLFTFEWVDDLNPAWDRYEQSAGQRLADEDRVTDAMVLGDEYRPPDVLAVIS